MLRVGEVDFPRKEYTNGNPIPHGLLWKPGGLKGRGKWSNYIIISKRKKEMLKIGCHKTMEKLKFWKRETL